MLSRFFRSVSPRRPQPSHPAPFCEPLERREFLSVAGDACDVVAAERSARALVVPRTDSPQLTLPALTGKYRGTVAINRPSRSVIATLTIRRQTPEGQLKGTISSRFLGPVKFSARATVDRAGKITVAFSKPRLGVSGLIEGTRDAGTGDLDGTFTVNVEVRGYRPRISGTFSLEKIA